MPQPPPGFNPEVMETFQTADQVKPQSTSSSGLTSRNSYSLYDPGPNPDEIIKRLGLQMPKITSRTDG